MCSMNTSSYKDNDKYDAVEHRHQVPCQTYRKQGATITNKVTGRLYNGQVAKIAIQMPSQQWPSPCVIHFYVRLAGESGSKATVITGVICVVLHIIIVIRTRNPECGACKP